MHDENRQGKGVSRRSLLKGAAATSLALTAGCGGSDGGSEPDFRPPATPPPDTPVEGKNSIEIENAETGTQAWRLTNTSTVPGKVNGIITSGRSPRIE